MKHDKEFHVFSCDASTDKVSLSWAICDEKLHIVECAQLQYLRSNTCRHSDRFVPSVEHMREVLGAQYHDLGCICCTIGPGSFTGLRNTLAFVKGLIAVRTETPIRAIAVRTHDAIAYRYSNAKTCDIPLLVVNDARSGRYYVALYSPRACGFKHRRDNLHADTVEPVIYDYSVDEIRHLVSDCSALACAGNAAESLVALLQKRNNAMRLEVLSSATCTMAYAVHRIGLNFYEENAHEITQCSQPLYIRSAV